MKQQFENIDIKIHFERRLNNSYFLPSEASSGSFIPYCVQISLVLLCNMRSIFEESTQFQFWTYTPESLRLARMTAIASPRTTVVSEREVIVNPKIEQTDSASKNKKPKKLKLKGR